MKKTIYISLVVLLGFLFSMIAHALIERWQINYLLEEQIVPENEGFFGKLCYLSPILSYSIFLIGIFGGFLAGKSWWRIVYVEKRHWKNKNKKRRK